MSRAEKMLQRMKNNPQDWSIDDLITVTDRHGIECRNDGGNHHVFSHPAVAEAVTVPAHRPVKPFYVKKIVELIEKVREVSS